MILNEEIMSNHRHFSRYGAAFIQYARENPGCLQRSNYKLMQWPDKRIRFQPWPTFINKARVKEIETAAIAICNLVKSIPRRLFDNDIEKICKYFKIPRDIVELQMEATNEAHIKDLLARGDFIFDSSGIKCIEYNVSSDLGGLEKSIWESIYLDTESIASFVKKYDVKILNKDILHLLLAHLFAIAQNKWPQSDEVNIAFVIESYSEKDDRETEIMYLNRVYENLLRATGQSLRGQVMICNYNRLKANDEGIFLNGKRIRVLLEIYSGIVLPEIVEHFKKGNILFYNGPITRLLSNKLNLVLLSENQDSDIFNTNEKEAIKKYIPWTRKVAPTRAFYGNAAVELEDFIIANKDKLVLKPAEGYGGIGVSIGNRTAPSLWREKTAQVMEQGNWLVQEHVKPLDFYYQTGENGYAPHHVIWGGFVLGSQFAGIYVRMLTSQHPNGVINRSSGGEEGVTFEVEE